MYNLLEHVALRTTHSAPAKFFSVHLSQLLQAVPVDLAVSTIAEPVFRGKERDSNSQEVADVELAYHVLSPRVFSFKHDPIPMLQNHPDVPTFEVVDVNEWLERLRNSQGDVERDPSRKLLGSSGRGSTELLSIQMSQNRPQT